MVKMISNLLGKVVFNFPALGYIVYGWEIEETDIVPLFGTNGGTLFVNRKTMEDDVFKDVLLFGILHEVVHCMLLHVNIRTDDPILILAIEIVCNMHTEVLAKNLNGNIPNTFCPLCKKKVDRGTGISIPMCSRCFSISETLSEVYKKLKERVSEEEAKSILDSGSGRSLNEPKNFRNPFAGDFMKGEAPNERMNEVKVSKVLEEPGQLPLGLVRAAKGSLESFQKIPIDEFLYSFFVSLFMGEEICVNLRNHLFHSHNVIVEEPSMSRKIDSLTVAIDTSASIGDETLEKFISILKGLIREYRDRFDECLVVFFDAEIQSASVLQDFSEERIREMCKGNGGTDFRPIFKKFDRPDGLIIVMTDGMGYYPTEKVKSDVLWLLTPEHEEPPFGKIHVIS